MRQRCVGEEGGGERLWRRRRRRRYGGGGGDYSCWHESLSRPPPIPTLYPSEGPSLPPSLHPSLHPSFPPSPRPPAHPPSFLICRECSCAYPRYISLLLFSFCRMCVPAFLAPELERISHVALLCEGKHMCVAGEPICGAGERWRGVRGLREDLMCTR